MNRIPFRFAILLGFPLCLFGQQESTVTQFWNTYQYSNPATSGLFSRINAAALYRGYPNNLNSPEDLYAGGSARIHQIHGGVGLSYQRSHSGWNTMQTAIASYAYHFTLAPGKILSAGVSGGWKHADIGINGDYIAPVYFRDNNFVGNVGVAYADSNWRAGISCTNLNQPAFRASANYSYTLKRHLWAFVEHDFHFGNVTLTPRVGGVTDFDQLTFSASVTTMFNNRLWFGANYMYQNSVGLMVGYDFYGKFRIGYSYDLLANSNSFADGIHEIVLAFTLK